MRTGVRALLSAFCATAGLVGVVCTVLALGERETYGGWTLILAVPALGLIALRRTDAAVLATLLMIGAASLAGTELVLDPPYGDFEDMLRGVGPVSATGIVAWLALIVTALGLAALVVATVRHDHDSSLPWRKLTLGGVIAALVVSAAVPASAALADRILDEGLATSVDRSFAPDDRPYRPSAPTTTPVGQHRDRSVRLITKYGGHRGR